MEKFDHSKYIGIPFSKDMDCWGLTRKIYKQEFNIELPAFDTQYNINDEASIVEAIARRKEGWDKIDEPEVGCIALFRIMGYESHVGVVVSKTHYIDLRENRDSVLESLESPTSVKRLVGYYRYAERTEAFLEASNGAIINAIPHPLQTQRIVTYTPVGSTVEQTVAMLLKEFGNKVEYNPKFVVMLNGVPVAKEDWNSTYIKQGDALEYRVIPGKKVISVVLLIAVAVFAPYLATQALGAYATAVGAAGGVVTAAMGAAVYYGTYAAVTMIGSAIVSRITAPSMPGQPTNPGSTEAQLMVQGGGNQTAPYGAIPVVLGKVRMYPLLGSIDYLTYENGRDSYLSRLMVWGYGPLSIDTSSFKFGDVALSNYTDYQIETLDRKTEVSQTAFNQLYGQDVDQKQVQQELVREGDPKNSDQTFVVNSTTNSDEYGVITRAVVSFRATAAGQPMTATLTTTNGTAASWAYSTSKISSVSRTVVNSNTVVVTGVSTATSGTISDFASISFTVSGSNSGTLTVNLESTLPAGPWIQVVSTQPGNYKAQVAVHFPEGLRKIVLKGDNAGDTQATSVQLRIETSSDGLTWTTDLTPTIRAKSKDAFTDVFTLSATNRNYVRVRRETGDNAEDDDRYRYYFRTVLLNVAFVANLRPAVDPVGAKIAKTALRIKASDQLGQSTEGFNGLVQTWCKVWNGSSWVMGASSNPAALMRYVLEHPGFARRITSDSKLDLASLQYFYDYCQSRGFEYNGVISQPKSLWETLKDICAAGRASPHRINGKWTVLIDEPKSVVQHFTPHNSWGFEGTKPLPKYPHGLRVNYFDQDQQYQEAEIIVYNTGYNITNASLFESISLPGITKKSLVIDHCRWHFAQMKLRPEIYTLNTDVEYIVCNRGDRVKVMHDVPMWGLGSGRIKTRISSSQFVLTEQLYFEADKSYTIRIRSVSGASQTRSVVPKTVSGYYDDITVTVSLSSEQATVDDLFMFGETNLESQDLTVLSIEPSENKSARITLTDYGVTNTYNIFTDYLSLTENVVFETQISQPPNREINSFGSATPTISGFVSDESVMEQISSGVFRYNINVAYYNPYQLPTNVSLVQAQYDLSDSIDTLSAKYAQASYQNGSVNIPDVEEGLTYKVRMRYIGSDGVYGQWSDYSSHTVIGKTNPPSSVVNFTAVGDKTSGQVKLSWDKNPEVDVARYEIRDADNAWGTENGRLFFGNTTTAFVVFENTKTYYIRAVDYFGNYSTNSTSVVYTAAPVAPVTGLTSVFDTSSLTNSQINFSWIPVTNSEYNIVYYEFDTGITIETVQLSTFSVPANWVGDQFFQVRSVDIHNKKSAWTEILVTKTRPGILTDIKTQVIDNTVMLFWKLPLITSLPISHVLLKRGSSWSSPDFIVGQKSGEFTTDIRNQGGEVTYWLAAVDTSGVESIPVSITTLVDEPPDFVFNGDFTSDFTGTLVNAFKDVEGVALPVDTAETWQNHFTTRTWSSPQDQVTAGYPYYVQPTNLSGYYEEVFDFGTTLASSRVEVVFTGETVVAPVTLNTILSVSNDAVTWVDYPGLTSIFGTNFRYIKFRITATSTTDKGLYRLNYLYIKLDAKLKSDSGTVAVGTSSTGTIVNFNKEFIDVTSVICSPKGTTAAYVVNDFNDNIQSSTYAVSSNVCTVTFTDHGYIAGQKVRISTSSGTGINGVYTITSASSNTYTVAMVTANTSGNCTVYPQGMRLYRFNSAGALQAGDVSWSVEGY